MEPLVKWDETGRVYLEGSGVGDQHYIETLEIAIMVAKHVGARVVMDVYDAEEILKLLKPGGGR